MNTLSRTEIEQVIRELLHKYHAEYALLFGSYARGEATAASDIDVIVVGGANFRARDIFAFGEELRQRTQKDVDAFEIREVNTGTPFYESIMREGVRDRMKRSDKERLKKIVATWESLKAEMHKRGITPELLLEDEFSQWAVTTPLYNIGEQVYQLSPEFKASYPEQPWNMVAGLRHRLVHDYDGINWSIIVEVLFEDMEPFVTAVNAILAGM